MADKSCSVRLPSFSGAFIILRIFRQEFVINSKTSLYNLRFVSKCFQGDFPFLFMGFPLSKPLQKAFIPKIIWEIEATEVSFYLDHRFRMKIIGWKLNGKSIAWLYRWEILGKILLQPITHETYNWLSQLTLAYLGKKGA